MAQPRQTRLRLLFTKSDKDVSQDIMPDLLSFSYDDKEANEVDEISISLKDPQGKWAGTWKPDGGESVRAYIINGSTQNKYKQIYCGRFYVDSLRTAGNPRTCEIRAVSIPLNKPIRKRLRSRAWEKYTLKDIAAEICNNAGIKLLFDSDLNPSYKRLDQKQESDLKFLSGLCEEIGLSLKVTDDKIVIFSQESYEKKKPVKTFTLGKSDILSWDFDCSQSEQYRAVTITYRDPKQKVKGSAGGYKTDSESDANITGGNPAVFTYTATDETVGEDGQEYIMKKRATSADEAKRLARGKLRALNRRYITGSMSVMGDVDLVAGVVIKCVGFGSFDGLFYVQSAQHNISPSGYVTNLEVARVNTNY